MVNWGRADVPDFTLLVAEYVLIDDAVFVIEHDLVDLKQTTACDLKILRYTQWAAGRERGGVLNQPDSRCGATEFRPGTEWRHSLPSALRRTAPVKGTRCT